MNLKKLFILVFREFFNILDFFIYFTLNFELKIILFILFVIHVNFYNLTLVGTTVGAISRSGDIDTYLFLHFFNFRVHKFKGVNY